MKSIGIFFVENIVEDKLGKYFGHFFFLQNPMYAKFEI